LHNPSKIKINDSAAALSGLSISKVKYFTDEFSGSIS
jgi:hypothetical protein